MRDHSPITIENFNGLFDRGGADSVPLDHWSDCNNVQVIEGGFETRPGINTLVVSEDASIPDVLQVYTYRKLESESLLVLDINGNIFDTGSPTPLTPILTIPTMIDFGFTIIDGRAYISPTADKNHGMINEFVYVYKGDGITARKAAGQPPKDADGIMTASAGSTGNVEAGVHIFGVVYETDTGFDTQIGPDTLATITASGTTTVDLSSIPVSPNSYVTKRRIVATRAIDPTLYTGNTRGYQFFFVPDGEIDDNLSTSKTVNFFDIELLEDASNLLDLFSEIPAGVGLGQYRNRMLVWALQPDNEHAVVLVSNANEPEAFDQVTGLIQLQGNNNSITICQQLRDVLYIFNSIQTFGTQDNGDVPATWSIVALDQGYGASLHGIATCLDVSGTNADFLIICNYSGIFLFTGTFSFPEFSFKVANLWAQTNFNDFTNIEIYNDTVLKRIYIIMPNQQIILVGDYQHGLDAQNVRWMKWTFIDQITSITLWRIDQLVIAAKKIES